MNVVNSKLILNFLIVVIKFSNCFHQIKCKENELVVYNLAFEADWTPRKFPKQYPEFRPRAHWSKLIGITHDDNYTLFRIGDIATKEFQLFAETGKTDQFNVENVNGPIYDEFSSPSLKNGSGKAEVNFFVDGNHSMVSIAVKIIPSPDWFVGIDSFNLCIEGNWIDVVTIEASPIDAGTDNGFTFTAPNWASDPQERIYKITSKYPRHPANSFYYPKLEDLPPIAKFTLRKKPVYRRVETDSEFCKNFSDEDETNNNDNKDGGTGNSNSIEDEIISSSNNSNSDIEDKSTGSNNNTHDSGKNENLNGSNSSSRDESLSNSNNKDESQFDIFKEKGGRLSSSNKSYDKEEENRNSNSKDEESQSSNSNDQNQGSNHNKSTDESRSSSNKEKGESLNSNNSKDENLNGSKNENLNSNSKNENLNSKDENLNSNSKNENLNSSKDENLNSSSNNNDKNLNSISNLHQSSTNSSSMLIEDNSNSKEKHSRHPHKESTALHQNHKLPKTENQSPIDITQSDDHQQKSHRRKKSKKNHTKCKVSEWSQWSGCSNKCGAGISTRTRDIKTRKRAKCPKLTEKKECSDFTECYKSVFKW